MLVSGAMTCCQLMKSQKAEKYKSCLLLKWHFQAYTSQKKLNVILLMALAERTQQYMVNKEKKVCPRSVIAKHP